MILRFPDISAYNDPEIVFHLKKKNHVGFVIASPDPYRVRYLQDECSRRIYTDFFAKLPPSESLTSQIFAKKAKIFREVAFRPVFIRVLCNF